MIFTVTLNPSIDYVVRLDKLTNGITNRTTSEEYYFGGKGINVSCVLAELGLDSTAYGFVAGFTGEAIEKGIRNDRIITDFIKLKHGISRINIKIKAGEETEINCQGPHIDDSELERLLQKIDRIANGDTLVIAGSIPNTMPDDVYERMLERISRKDVKIVVDATKQLLVNSLKYKPFLIKPNRQELSEIFGTEVKTEEDIEKYAKELQKMGAKNVLISLGGEGAMLIDENGEKHKAGVLKEKVINTVGSGDSMVAGFVAGYEKEHSYPYALKLGSVCGNATAFLSGLATREKIDELLVKFEKEFES
ncbi:MAG: 1-phosphofructokinase [Ruminococcus sp.]|nr:1-phosphofructokinase [Ruminococcus sp.]MEE1016081.1 1-phosphofructokinase [Ruminococcus sp.]